MQPPGETNPQDPAIVDFQKAAEASPKTPEPLQELTPEGIGELFRKNGAALLRFASKLKKPDITDADDLVSQAMAGIIARVSPNDIDGTPKPDYEPVLVGSDGGMRYLYKAIRTEGARALRQARYRPTRSPLPYEDAITQAASARNITDDIEFSALASELLTKISPEFFRALYLYYVSGYSQKEIAKAEDIPLSTVRTRIHRAKNKLRASLQENGLK